MLFPKVDLYRNERLTRTAEGRDCTILLPTTVNHGRDTVVWCHSNWAEHGKGSRLKAHDCFGAFGCAWCHAEIDQGKRFSNEQKRSIFSEAMKRTREELLSSLTVTARLKPLDYERMIGDDDYWLACWKGGLLEVKRAR